MASWSPVTITSAPAGAAAGRSPVSASRACAGSCPGARRIDSVARATDGTTVRGSPAPIALTSSDASAPLRS